MPRLDSRTIAATAVFTAFTAAVTAGFTVVIPVTNGYFDVGEIMVYIEALLMGPLVGGFAGGVGSAISDALFAPAFAPGTLVVKGLEGLIVGYLGTRVFARIGRTSWRLICIGLGALLALFVGGIGTTYLSGTYSVTLGFSEGGPTAIGPQVVTSFAVPPSFWLVLAAVVFVAMVVVGLKVDEKLGWTVLSVLAGGAVMVTGYLLYEWFVLNEGLVSAAGEVPFNIAQVVIGLLVAIPLVRTLRRIMARTQAAKPTA